MAALGVGLERHGGHPNPSWGKPSTPARSRAKCLSSDPRTNASRVETTIGRFKQVIGDGLRSQTDARQETEIAVSVYVLNRMLTLGRPASVRIA